jgi:hypothetical protein
MTIKGEQQCLSFFCVLGLDGLQSRIRKNIAKITTKKEGVGTLHGQYCADIIKKYIKFRENDDDIFGKKMQDIEIVQKITKIIHC